MFFAVSVETSAATGQNVALAVEMLLEMVMKRMDQAVEDAFGPGHRGRAVHLEVGLSVMIGYRFNRLHNAIRSLLLIHRQLRKSLLSKKIDAVFVNSSLWHKVSQHSHM